MFTIYDNLTNFPKIFFCQIILKCEHEFYSSFLSVNMKNTVTLLLFDKFFLHICAFAVLYNVNTVRSEMWVWFFPNHLSSTRDLTRFFGICDLEKPILTFPSHSILSLLWILSHYCEFDDMRAMIKQITSNFCL